MRTLALFVSAFALLKKLALKLIIVIPLVLKHNTGSAVPYAIDGFVFVYFACQQKYFPGSLYNEVHALMVGRKFRKVLRL